MEGYGQRYVIFNEENLDCNQQNSPYQNHDINIGDDHEDPSNLKPLRINGNQYNPGKIDNFSISREVPEEIKREPYSADASSQESDKVNYALTTEQSRCLFNKEPVEREDFKEYRQIIKKKNVLKDFMHQAIENNLFEKTNLSRYKSHFEHAFSCPKICGGQECWIQECSNPQEIVTFVNNCLEKEYNAKNNEGEQKTINMVHFVVIWHSVTCSQPNICSMPLCCKVEQIASKLIPECVEEDYFQICYSSDNVSGSYEKGNDFDILFDMQLGKGAFGNITYSLFTNKYGSKSSVIIKQINLTNTPQVSDSLSRSLPALRRLTNCPNVLVPHLILHGDGRVLMFMEKGDMSLFDLMRCRNEMCLDEVTFYMSQIIDGISQIHKCGLTHCDIKVSNCVLTDRGKVLKIIDLDTLKNEEEIALAGTRGYMSPDVFNGRNVKQKDDVYSAVSCIPVLLYGTEKVHDLNREQILELVQKKDGHLAAMFLMGTEPFNKRFTSSALQMWFRNSSDLQQRVNSFQPSLPNRNVRFRVENFVEGLFRQFFESTLDSMQRRREPVESCDNMVMD